jgi:aarF domain-containing kinase
MTIVVMLLNTDVDVSPIVHAFNNCFDNALNAIVSELNFKTIVDGLGVVLYQYPFNGKLAIVQILAPCFVLFFS